MRKTLIKFEIGNNSLNKNLITKYLTEDKTMSFYVNK